MDFMRETLREGSFTGEPFFFFFFCFFFFFEPEDINSVSLGVIWNFSGVTGLP
jgi:hypothetical protein